MKTLQKLLGLLLTTIAIQANAQDSLAPDTSPANIAQNTSNIIKAASETGTAEKPTGLSETDMNNIVISRAYPVPVMGDVHVDVLCPAEENATLKLIDISGRTELERPVKLVNGENHFEISMDDMAGGMYQLIVQTDTKRIAYRIVKAR
jgi:hypothetical protein